MKKRFIAAAGIFLAAGTALAVLAFSRPDLPPSLAQIEADASMTQFLDRNGEPLNYSYASYWNVHDKLPLYRIPERLQKMFVASEDKRFFEHGGTDWRARASAVVQNVRAGKVVRGASTLTEQVVRMIFPRPRTYLSKLQEGLDAARFERRYSKADILEFYLNQVPYASNRRGVLQASKYYFSKTPDRLSLREMTALTVLVRAPSSYDPYRYPERLDALVSRQLQKFKESGVISDREYEKASKERLRLSSPSLRVSAEKFLAYVKSVVPLDGRARKTTLDVFLQAKVGRLARSRLKDMKRRGVNDVAVLVLERRTGNVLAWVGESLDGGTADFDPVTVLRQPASAQKPLLYALALSEGLTAATKIRDAPFSAVVGKGVHRFHNYSNVYYGDVTLRQALGNSLNIPALKVIGFVGVSEYLDFLKRLGFSHLDKDAQYYREGLALGNAEVTLLELTRAYLMLANAGVLKDVRVAEAQPETQSVRVLPESVATLIGDILSDPQARRLEFGGDSILNFPVQTAVKTGTSTGYRDAWAMGYSSEFVVGVWMGNLTYRPTDEVTGALGPALLLRSVFGALNENADTAPLYLSPKLERRRTDNGTELFATDVPEARMPRGKEGVYLSKPEDGIFLALDPRVPTEFQKYRFELEGMPDGAEITWVVDGKEVGKSKEADFFWPLERGEHTVFAKVRAADGSAAETNGHTFTVR